MLDDLSNSSTICWCGYDHLAATFHPEMIRIGETVKSPDASLAVGNRRIFVTGICRSLQTSDKVCDMLASILRARDIKLLKNIEISVGFKTLEDGLNVISSALIHCKTVQQSEAVLNAIHGHVLRYMGNRTLVLRASYARR